MKRWTIPAVLFLLTACTPQAPAPQPVRKSLYLNKRLMKFEMDNGYCYRRVALKNGNTLHYWRSDTGRLISIATGRDDNFPDYCELALETDPARVIRKIYIIEPSVICNTVLK